MNGTDTRHGLGAIRAGLAGYPVSHSLSPRLYSAAAANLGMDCSYELLPCREEEFAGMVRHCATAGFHGINVTTPHKRNAFSIADSHTDTARLTGNANTLLFENGRITAVNTDTAGFSRALTEHACHDPAGRRAVVLGTGSVAASVLLALTRLDCRHVTVGGRSRSSLEAFFAVAEACCGVTGLSLIETDSESMMQAISDADLVVNCSSAGMAGKEDESPLSGFYQCRPGLLAMDLVYSPPVTRFIAQMRNCGARTENGLAMLACQAAESFTLMSGQLANPAQMLAALGRS